MTPSITITAAYERLRIFLEGYISIEISTDSHSPGKIESTFKVWNGRKFFTGTTLLEAIRACEADHISGSVMETPEDISSMVAEAEPKKMEPAPAPITPPAPVEESNGF